MSIISFLTNGIQIKVDKTWFNSDKVLPKYGFKL